MIADITMCLLCVRYKFHLKEGEEKNEKTNPAQSPIKGHTFLSPLYFSPSLEGGTYSMKVYSPNIEQNLPLLISLLVS